MRSVRRVGQQAVEEPPHEPVVIHGRHDAHVGALRGPLVSLPFGVKPQPILSAPSGTFSYVFTEAVPDSVPGHWRASFDFTAAGPGVVEMRLFLKNADQTLSETWLYQYTAT